MLQGMDDLRVGAAFRAVRLRRRWRQSDVAARAGVSQSFVSLVERGHLDRVSLSGLRRLGRALDIRVDLIARWRGGALDRMLALEHSLLAEEVVTAFSRYDGWRPRSVSRWLIVTRSSTNSRRIEAHRSVLRAAFPRDGRAVRAWLAAPSGVIDALSTWSVTTHSGRGRSSIQRVQLDRRGPTSG